MMKFISVCILVVAFASSASAGWVDGYYRSDGTKVDSYYRTSPNSTVQDNYNYKGNYNPYTGETGTNYYRDDSSSQYYDPFNYYE